LGGVEGAERVERLLGAIYERLTTTTTADGMDTVEGLRRRSVLLELVIGDLSTLVSLEDELATPASLLHHFLCAVKLHDSAMRTALADHQRLTDDPTPLFALIDECAEKVAWIGNQYTGLSADVTAFLAECSLRLKLLTCAVRLAVDPALYEDACQALNEEIQRAVEALGLPATPPTIQLLSWVSENFRAAKASEGEGGEELKNFKFKFQTTQPPPSACSPSSHRRSRSSISPNASHTWLVLP